MVCHGRWTETRVACACPCGVETHAHTCTCTYMSHRRTAGLRPGLVNHVKRPPPAAWRALGHAVTLSRNMRALGHVTLFRNMRALEATSRFFVTQCFCCCQARPGHTNSSKLGLGTIVPDGSPEFFVFFFVWKWFTLNGHADPGTHTPSYKTPYIHQTHTPPAACHAPRAAHLHSGPTEEGM